MTYHGHWWEVAPDLLSFTLSAHHPPMTPSTREPLNPLPPDSAPPRYPYHLPFLSPPFSEGPGSPPDSTTMPVGPLGTHSVLAPLPQMGNRCGCGPLAFWPFYFLQGCSGHAGVARPCTHTLCFGPTASWPTWGWRWEGRQGSGDSMYELTVFPALKPRRAWPSFCAKKLGAHDGLSLLRRASHVLPRPVRLRYWGDRLHPRGLAL